MSTEADALTQIRSVVPFSDADAAGFLSLGFDDRLLVLQAYKDAAAITDETTWQKVCDVIARGASFASMIAPIVGLGVSLAAL